MINWQHLTTFGLVSLFTTGCSTVLADTPSPTATSPASTIMPYSSPTSSPSPTPSPTLWFTPTPLPSPTPWSTPVAWVAPTQLPLPPTLAPVPVIPALTPVSIVSNVQNIAGGAIPVSYSPPDDVDVFGDTVLHWEFYGHLAEDEFFDIKIKPLGNENSVFVDWTKDNKYHLIPWSGWQGGAYTWQIGIIKGHLEGDTKHFISDTGRDSKPFIIKWQGFRHSSDDSSDSSSSGGGGGNSGGS
ncbi:hypothetical protein QUF64_04205 [Anaerolineales bacterium HSG6]|nr:hypothetical protein [Anaerolineales bacterium HSG6]